MSIGQGNITVQSKKEAGEATQANNGLTLTGNLVQLGGGLITNTYIGLSDAFEFAFQGSDGDNVLLLDEVNGIYFFGFDTAGDRVLVTGWSFDETNIIEGRAAGKVGLRIVQTLAGFEAYLGDVNNDANGTKIIILDNDNFIEIRNGNAQLFYAERNPTISAGIGDIADEQNGTKILINDDNQQIELTNVPTGAITDNFATFDGDQIKKIPAPVESGTYTPTAVAGSNVASIIEYPCQYLRVGQVVNFSGQIEITVTTPGITSDFTINPPIPTAIGNANELSGAGIIDNASSTVQSIANDGTGNAFFSFIPAVGTTIICFNITYLITAAP